MRVIEANMSCCTPSAIGHCCHGMFSLGQVQSRDQRLHSEDSAESWPHVGKMMLSPLHQLHCAAATFPRGTWGQMCSSGAVRAEEPALRSLYLDFSHWLLLTSFIVHDTSVSTLSLVIYRVILLLFLRLRHQEYPNDCTDEGVPMTR